MIDPIDSEPLAEPVLTPDPEPEEAAAGLDLEPENYEWEPEEDYPDDEYPESEPDLDYERIIGGVAERIAQAAMQMRQSEVDPYEQVAYLMHENPAEALRLHGELVRRQTLQDVMPYVAPAAQSHAVHQVTQGLEPVGQEFVHQFLKETGIDPTFLNDPTIADLVRSKAELHQIRKGGQAPIPRTESVGGAPGANVDAETRRELSGMERLYKSLGIKFDPARIIGRMK